MDIAIFNVAQRQNVINLYRDVFTDSEGASEGGSLAELVSALIDTTDENDLIGFLAYVDGSLIGCIFFSRLVLPSGSSAVLLSPVAVSTQYQGQGHGQALVGYGLDYLRRQMFKIVITYGDPAFYGKLGFQNISERFIEPPFKLSQPQGWLAQSLTQDPLQAEAGKIACVAAFNDSRLW